MNFTTFGWKPNGLLQRKCKVTFIIVFIISMCLWQKGDINTVGLSLFYIICFSHGHTSVVPKFKGKLQPSLTFFICRFQKTKGQMRNQCKRKNQPQAHAISNTKLAGLKINPPKKINCNNVLTMCLNGLKYDKTSRRRSRSHYAIAHSRHFFPFAAKLLGMFTRFF